MTSALPHRRVAYVPDAKLDFLLTSKKRGGLFRSLGYSADSKSSIEALRQGLLLIAQTQPVVKTLATDFGKRYDIIGHLNTPAKGLFEIRTGWMIDTDNDAPRFITAFPARQ